MVWYTSQSDCEAKNILKRGIFAKSESTVKGTGKSTRKLVLFRINCSEKQNHFAKQLKVQEQNAFTQKKPTKS
jgi:hypothetical protein